MSTCTLISKIDQGSLLNGLQSKDNFDNVKPLNGKPSADTEGFHYEKTSHSMRTNAKDEQRDTFILAQAPNLYKQTGVIVSKIPYFFETPVPSYFRKKGWFKNPKCSAFVSWAFSRCSKDVQEIQHDGNKITLQPYQFIFGRRVCSDEIGLTEDEVRTQVNSMQKAGFLKKSPNKTPSRFTILEWVTSDFLITEPQVIPQPTPKSPPSDPHKQDSICSVCSVSVCICKKKEDMDILQEHKKVQKTHPNGNSFEMSKSDLFTLSVLKKADWSVKEIDQMWEIFVEYSQPIRDVFKFCEGTIKNIRKMIAIKKINDEKPKCYNQKKTENSKKPLENSKEKTTENVTLGRPLANWKSQINPQKPC